LFDSIGVDADAGVAAAFVYLITFYASHFVDAWRECGGGARPTDHIKYIEYIQRCTSQRLHGRRQRHRHRLVVVDGIMEGAEVH